MFSRFRIAAGLALLLALLTPITALAKGAFSFISITGPDLKEPIRISDLALTEDFFTFADFYRDGTETPADPGIGYEITRYYVDGKRESAFDKLHYYPDTGFVYYDGIVNGSSEYDKKWYTARPDIKTIFESAIYSQIRLVMLGSPEAAQALVPPPQSVNTIDPTQASQIFPQPQLILLITVSAILVMALAFSVWRRRSLVQ
jgi:hypothetical protein